MKAIRATTLAAALAACHAGDVAAEPACFPRSMAAEWARQNPNDPNGFEAADRACRKVLEAKEGGQPAVERVLALALAGRKTGGDRLKPAAPMGMPTGPVMPRGGLVELNAGEVAGEEPLALDIDGPQVSIRARPLPASNVVALPAAQLRPGVEYRWVLTTRRQRYEGSFTLPDADTSQRTRTRLAALAQARPDRVTALLLEAAIYDDEELFASRDQAIVEYRRESRK